LVQTFLKKWWVESDFKAPNSSTRGTYINEGNEYMPQNTNSMQSFDYNHGHSGNSAYSQHDNRVFGSNFQLGTTNVAPQGSSSIYNIRSSG
jgi:hypothetical protein